VRHKLPVLVVISLNGGWTADPKREKAGRELGYTRFDEVAKALGCAGEWVERAEDIRPRSNAPPPPSMAASRRW
jgi:thiamine pyrophosphate-dependent acetolactate synthase large subunit-like protein